MRASFATTSALEVAGAQAMERAARSLLDRQHPDGYWWGNLTADTTLEADYLLLELWMHPPVNGVWTPPNPERMRRAVRSILDRQMADGGFSIYPHGPSEVNACVKSYFALKLAGVDAADARMAKLRERILSLGGIQATNSYVKINLSLFNLFPQEHAPIVPIEIMLMRDVIYEMSSWSRAIVIPLAIVQAHSPRHAPAGFTLDELIKPGVGLEFGNSDGFFSWRTFFISLDRAFKFWATKALRGRPLQVIRKKALQAAEKWMLERTRHSDGLAAIYPPMMYTMMALDALGYSPEHPDAKEARRQFENLIVDEDDRFFFQPCFSPVWDTAIVAYALGEAGFAGSKGMQRCADWLMTKEVRQKGDWSIKRPNVEPSGWYFEFANEFYPDIDDTAMVLLGLKHARSLDTQSQRACTDRAVKWLLAMQGSDGGWAAFDVDNNWDVLNAVPFADHNAMLDPSCPDITGRVIEALCQFGVPTQHPAIRKGVEYLKRNQEADGSWYGRWGVAYVYGTFLALRGLRAAGEDDREACILRAGEWLRSIQNADGGWGESCESYDRNSFVAARSTASQTAWGILGLIASGDTESENLHHAVEFLVSTQDAGGRWHEDLATGTGFPKVFYLTYHLYRDSFPVLALASYLKTRNG